MSGRRFRGVCGHLNEFIVGQYAQCLVKGCDMKPRCPQCLTLDIEPYSAPMLPSGAFHCRPNGHVWWPQ